MVSLKPTTRLDSGQVNGGSDRAGDRRVLYCNFHLGSPAEDVDSGELFRLSGSTFWWETGIRGGSGQEISKFQSRYAR